MSQLVNMIEYQVKRKGLSTNQLLPLIGVKETTYYRRKHDPDDYKLKQLRKLAKILNIKIVIDADGTVKADGEI